MFLLDTCALLWWTLDPERLSKRAAKACRDIEREGKGVASSIVALGLLRNLKIITSDVGMRRFRPGCIW